MYHTYINNRYTDQQVKQIAGGDGPSKTYKDVLNNAEVDLLRSMISKIEYPEIGKTSKYSGASYNDEQGVILKKIFDDKIKNMIGEYELDFFAWQEAIIPWKIHADIRWYKDKLPYKVILFPLDVVCQSGNQNKTHTIAFKQRNYLEANKNTGEGKKGNTDQSQWTRPCDHPGVRNLVDGYRIDKETHNKYFSHMPYESLEGLEIDNIFEWIPGNCVVWDQNQLHCADNFLKNNIKTKLSLIFFTNQKQ